MGVTDEIHSCSWHLFITDTGSCWSYTDLFRAFLGFARNRLDHRTLFTAKDGILEGNGTCDVLKGKVSEWQLSPV